MARPKKYFTEEERKQARRECYQKNKEKQREYYQKNKERQREYSLDYYNKNRDKKIEYSREYYLKNKNKNRDRCKIYRKTQNGRATMLLKGYRRKDKLHNRGECTITQEWIIENVFHKCCHYCGESDWMKLGCDRKDNSKPHTPENCIPCCKNCNTKKNITPYDEFMKLIGKIN